MTGVVADGGDAHGDGGDAHEPSDHAATGDGGEAPEAGSSPGDGGAGEADVGVAGTPPPERAFEFQGKPALFVWSTSETEEAARAELAEFDRMRAPWPELDGLNIAPTWPRVVSVGPSAHLVVLGLCGPDTAPLIDRPLALVRLGRPAADLRAIDHQLGTKPSCPRTSGAVVPLPEVPVGKQTFAAAVVKRNRSGLPGAELNEAWDSLTLAVLRDAPADGGVTSPIVHSAMKDARRCADPQATVKKGTLAVVQRCIAADCDEASSVWFATTTTTWSVKAKKLVAASKTIKKAGRRCDAEEALDPP